MAGPGLRWKRFVTLLISEVRGPAKTIWCPIQARAGSRNINRSADSGSGAFRSTNTVVQLRRRTAKLRRVLQHRGIFQNFEMKEMMVRPGGFEPSTLCFGGTRSIQLT